MRFLLIIILAFYLLPKATAEPLLTNSKLDSIYQALSPTQKIRQLIWITIDGDDDLSSLDRATIEQNGGLYLTHPFREFDEYIYNRDFIPSLAMQLDDQLNPSPAELSNVPTLHTLSSIGDSGILVEYFGFLKNLCISYGIDYAVLPTTDKNHPREEKLLHKIKDYDPSFFLLKSELAFSTAKKKKEFIEVFEHSQFWTLTPEQLTLLNKSINKQARHIDFTAHSGQIKNSIFQKYAPANLLHKRKLSNKLAVAISRASIIPVQKQQGILPIKTDTICLITNRPFSPMALMLNKYLYVITAENGIKKSQSPIIIDDIMVDLSQYDVAGRQIIFVGELEIGSKYGQQLDGALLTSAYDPMYQYVLPQILLGAAGASGYNPVAIFNDYYNSPLRSTGKLGYAPPEMVGLDQDSQIKIEDIIKEAITTGSTPGCQLAIAVDGTIVLEEGYGHLTYDSLIQTNNQTLYDLASVTKVTATLLAVMKLYEQGKLSLDDPICTYLPEYDSTNKSNITIRQLLSHNAGLVSYIPFWKRAINADWMDPFYYKSQEDEKNDVRSYGSKPSNELMDSLKNWIRLSPVTSSDSIPKYRYSDIGFMMLHQVVETVAQQAMDEFLNIHFYQPLGLSRLTFSPMDKQIDRFEIAPTEYDYYFRNEQVWGQVHDRNAAIFGGVAGHAGLFSNAHDLVVILQMLAQGGHYGSKQLLLPSTIDHFNQKYYEGNRRALGWDKKGFTVSNASNNASEASFGHTGFTGTLVWVDPEFELVFVFLSNRIYPDANNYKLIRNDIRTRVQDVVYEAILSKWIN